MGLGGNLEDGIHQKLHLLQLKIIDLIDYLIKINIYNQDYVYFAKIYRNLSPK